MAVVIFGATVLLNSAAAPRLLWVMGFQNQYPVEPVAKELAAVASGGQVLVSVGAIVLGILALIGLAPLTLVLVGLLSLGTAVLFSGSPLIHRLTVIGRQP